MKTRRSFDLVRKTRHFYKEEFIRWIFTTCSDPVRFMERVCGEIALYLDWNVLTWICLNTFDFISVVLAKQQQQLVVEEAVATTPLGAIMMSSVEKLLVWKSEERKSVISGVAQITSTTVRGVEGGGGGASQHMVSCQDIQFMYYILGQILILIPEKLQIKQPFWHKQRNN